MQISTKDWLNYIRMLSQLNNEAGRLMQDYVAHHGFGDTEAIVDYAYGLITKYGEGSAALAAEMYDTTAALSNVAVPAAEVAETASYRDVARAVYGTIKQSKNPSSLGNTVSRYVKMAGADTTLKNAERDGAQFAWVPMGDTCAFCLTLASRGWQTISKKTLKNGHAEHIHANCDCTYSVRFDNKSGVRGYDPDKYLAMYRNAEGDTPQEKINSMRRMQYEDPAVRDKIRAQKREAYALRNKPLKKSISIDDIEKLKVNQNGDVIIQSEIIDSIKDSLENQNALNKFDAIKIDSVDDSIVFDTEMIQSGNWYNCNLIINRNFFGNMNLQSVNSIIKQSDSTVCENLDECIKHEIYHAKQTEKAPANVVRRYNNEPGIKGISTDAEKDMLETLSESGVLRDKGLYGTIPLEARKQIDAAAKELGLW